MTFVSLQDPFDTIDRTAIVAMRDESARGIRRRYCFLERFLVHDTRHPFNDNAGLLEFGSEHAPADVTTSSSGERPRPSAPHHHEDPLVFLMPLLRIMPPQRFRERTRSWGTTAARNSANGHDLGFPVPQMGDVWDERDRGVWRYDCVSPVRARVPGPFGLRPDQ